MTFHEINHRVVNQSLINRIKSDDSDDALKEIYSNYRDEFLIWAMKHYSCEMEEAKDAFQYSVVIFYENIIYGKLTEITSKLKTYLFSIGKNRIRELARKKDRHMLYVEDQIYAKYDIYYNDMDDGYEEKLKKVESCIVKLGDPCKGILQQYYYHKKNIQEIAEIFNFKSINSLKNKKFKCLEKLKQIIKSSGFNTL